MSSTADQLDSGGGITDLVFDENKQERRSWRFCNSRVPRSEVVYFTQFFIIVFLITVSLIKLAFFQLDCEESTVWFSPSLAELATHLQTQIYEKKIFQQAIDSLWECLVHLVVAKPN